MNLNFNTTTPSADSPMPPGMVMPPGMAMAKGAFLERREKVLGILPHVSASLSILGSALLAFRILKKRKTKDGMLSYHYLILAMTLVDIISSFAYAFGNTAGASGNQQTCSAQGFAIQFGIAVAFLNVILSMHYLCAVRWRVREHKLRKWTGPCLTAALVIGLALSVPLLVVNGYNRTPLWCSISPNFQDCFKNGLSPDVCFDQNLIWLNAMYYGPLWLCVGLATCLQFAIFWTVRSTHKRAEKWRLSSMGLGRSSWEQRRNRRLQRRHESSWAVATQSMLYLSSFYISWMPLTIASNVLAKEMNPLGSNLCFWILVVTATFQPLQGFLNCLVYSRRDIVRWMKLRYESLTIRCVCKCRKPLADAGETPAPHQGIVVASEDVEVGKEVEPESNDIFCPPDVDNENVDNEKVGSENFDNENVDMPSELYKA